MVLEKTLESPLDFKVERSGVAHVSTRQLLQKINSSVSDVEEIIGVRILEVFRKLCAGLDCPWKFCDEKVSPSLWT